MKFIQKQAHEWLPIILMCSFVGLGMGGVRLLQTTQYDSWPFGADGALVVDATTVNIAAGSVKDYSSCTLKNAGILNIQAGNTPTIIGCRDFLSMTGNSKIKGITGESAGGTFTATGPPTDRTAISCTITQSDGGAGGDAPQATSTPDPNPGGAQSSGNGGGGASGSSGASGGNASPTLSGAGADGEDDFGPEAGGAAVGLFSNNGNPGNSASGLTTVVGAGGSGGTRGRHGQAIYIKVASKLATIVMSGGSTIIATGTLGGTGGAGGDADFGALVSVGGGGGGGAAGGSGGCITAKTRTGRGTIASGNLTVTSAIGGLGGNGGSGNNGFGSGGLDGNAGVTGTKTSSTY